jgi:hypothetical protein
MVGLIGSSGVPCDDPVHRHSIALLAELFPAEAALWPAAYSVIIPTAARPSPRDCRWPGSEGGGLRN